MKLLQGAGYETSLFGKTHLHEGPGDLRQYEARLRSYGFDVSNEVPGQLDTWDHDSHWSAELSRAGLLAAYRAQVHPRYKNRVELQAPVLPYELNPDVYIADKTIDHINRAGPAPWFCWVSFVGPHPPRSADKAFARNYDSTELPPPANARAKNLSPALLENIRRDYAASVSLIDHQIGRLHQTLADTDQLKNTYIVFTSDHGEMNGDHGKLGKHVLFDGAVRVPLMIAGPGIQARRSNALIELFDVGATINELATGQNKFGSAVSFCHLLDETSADSHRHWVLCQYGERYMIANERYKLIVDLELLPVRLVDRTGDPDETRNATKDHVLIVKEMLAALKQKLAYQA